MPKKSTPICSARTPSSTTLRIVWACDSGRPLAVLVRSPKVSSPSTSGNSVSSRLAAVGITGWSAMSGDLSVFGAAEGLRSGVVVDRTFEVLTAEHCAEHRTSGLQHPAGAERSHRDGVVPDAVDEGADRV